MPVNYTQLLSQIDQMCEQQPAAEKERSRRLNDARQVLDGCAADLDGLRRRVELALADNPNLRCAVPVNEVLNCSYELTSPPPVSPTILAADGSQINPSRHERVFFGLINIGVFRMAAEINQIPQELTRSELLYPDLTLTPEEDLTEELVAFRRDLAEREWLAELTPLQPAPVVALTDGRLDLYRELLDDQRFKRPLAGYLDKLEKLVNLPVVTAGYVERPRSDLVIRLLELVGADPREKNQPRQYAGLPDERLFAGLLLPGHRSAVFSVQTPTAAWFATRAGGGLALHFFYINVGSERRPAVARVELHAWAAAQPWLVNLLHQTLLAQCACLGDRPYPYALHRAHEVALVRMHEREQIENWIIAGEMEAYARAGYEYYDFSPTSKQLLKSYASAGRSSRRRRS